MPTTRAMQPVPSMVVYYVPGGKDDLAHGSMIHVMAAVNFTPATAADKWPKQRLPTTSL